MKFRSLFIITLLILSIFITPVAVRADTEHSSGKVDFNGGASATQSGFTAFTGGGYDSGVGWGWTDSGYSPVGMATVDRGSGSGGALDDLEQDIHYAGAIRIFKIAAPNGSYNYIFYYGDNGYAHGPWTLGDNDGTEATDLSTSGSEWKHYHGTVTVTGGFIYIICTPQIADNMAYNGIEWELLNLPVTTTNYQPSTTIATTTALATSTVTLGTSLITTTKSGGTSLVTTTCYTTSNSNGTTVSVLVYQVVTSTVSVLNSITDPAGGTLTGYETSTVTCSSTTTLGSLVTETLSETTCETSTISSTYSTTTCASITNFSTSSTTTCDTSTESSTFSTTFCVTSINSSTYSTTTCDTSVYSSTSSTTFCVTSVYSSTSSTTFCVTSVYSSTSSTTTCYTSIYSSTSSTTICSTSVISSTSTTVTCSSITNLQCSTETTDITCATISGTSTYTDATTTITNFTETSIVGVIGGGCSWCIPLLMLLLILAVAYIVIRKRG